MKKIFRVLRGEKVFGTAEILREGLYYHIHVRCPNGERVFLGGEKGVRDLGICVPAEGEFRIDTRIPIKQIGEEKVTFWAESEHTSFYAVDPDKPFRHLNCLRNCVFLFRSGQAGVQMDISKPTGQ